MHTHAFTTALTLYRSGTITLAQAAQCAGYSEEAMAAALRSHGVSAPTPDSRLRDASAD